MSDDVVDVLIVGAGAAGAAVAWSLTDTGCDHVLEQGDWMNPATYPSTGMDWSSGPRRSRPEPNTRGLPADYPVNDADSPISISMFNAVGAARSSTLGIPTLSPSDFRVWSEDGVADDWPIDYGPSSRTTR